MGRLAAVLTAAHAAIQRFVRGGHRVDEDPDPSSRQPPWFSWSVVLRRRRGGSAGGEPDGPSLGATGSTPDQVWQAQTPILAEERRSFAASLQEQQASARRRQGHPAEGRLEPLSQAAVTRTALRKALVAERLLEILPEDRAEEPTPEA